MLTLDILYCRILLNREDVYKMKNSTYFKLSEYWDWLFLQDDYRLLFSDKLWGDEQKRLFNKYVRNINIETSAFCNKKCIYCPLSKIDRKQDYMSDEIWKKIIDELVSIGYSGRITLALFNEPLLDISIEKKIREINDRLPNVLIALYSNGDFLTRDRLDKLVRSGMDWLLITRHLEHGTEYNQQNEKTNTYRYIEELGLEEYIREYNEQNENNTSYHLEYSIENKNLELYVVTNNWIVTGNSRGNEIECLKSQNVRELPCAKAIRDFNISYKGQIKPCCNIYFGKNTNMGSIEEDGILHSYFIKLKNFRKEMFKFGKKTGGCMYCSDFDNAKIETKCIRDMI